MLHLPFITVRQKGGFVKGWFWRMCPRSGFLRGEHANVPSSRFFFGGTSEFSLVPVFVPGEHPPKPPFLENHPFSGKKKTNKHKHFRRDGLRDKQEPSLGQMGPLPGTKWDPSLGQAGLSLFNSTGKSPFCPVCPWDRWGFVPGTIVPQGPLEKCLCVFCLLVYLLPNLWEPIWTP